jgi:hypothetical protein
LRDRRPVAMTAERAVSGGVTEQYLGQDSERARRRVPQRSDERPRHVARNGGVPRHRSARQGVSHGHGRTPALDGDRRRPDLHARGGGRITEAGDHDQLFAVDGTYADLYTWRSSLPA